MTTLSSFEENVTDHLLPVYANDTTTTTTPEDYNISTTTVVEDWTTSPNGARFMACKTDVAEGNLSCITEATNTGVVASSAYSALEVVFMLIGFAGILGNVWAIAVILSNKKLRQKLTNHFLINQSAVDIMAGFFLVTNTLTRINELPEHFEGVTGLFLCRFWYSRFFLWLTLMASSYSLAVLSLERYLEIVHPVLHKVRFSRRKAHAMMVGAYLLVLVLHVAMAQATDGVISGECHLFTSWSSRAARAAYGLFSAFINYILPVGVHLFCYVHILVSLRRRQRNRQGPLQQASISSGNNHQQQENVMNKVQRNIFKVLFTVVVAYIVCFSWNTFLFLFYNLGLVGIDFGGWSYNLSVIMVYLNCCINPVIYTVQYREYRAAMRALLICRRNRVGPVTTTAESATVATSPHKRDTGKNVA